MVDDYDEAFSDNEPIWQPISWGLVKMDIPSLVQLESQSPNLLKRIFFEIGLMPRDPAFEIRTKSDEENASHYSSPETPSYNDFRPEFESWQELKVAETMILQENKLSSSQKHELIMDALGRTEGVFTLKSHIYQHQLRSLALGNGATLGGKHYLDDLSHTMPSIPVSKYDTKLIIQVRERAKKLELWRVCEHGSAIFSALLTTLVNKVRTMKFNQKICAQLLLLVLFQTHSWYFHNRARVQLTGRLFDVIWPDTRHNNVVPELSVAYPKDTWSFMASFVDQRIRNFRDAMARCTKITRSRYNVSRSVVSEGRHLSKA